jgi:hypothetical protein
MRGVLFPIMTLGLRSIFGFAIVLLAVACGGSTREARSADDEDGAGKKSHDDPSWYDNGSEESRKVSPPSDDSPSSSSSSSSKKKKSKQSDGSVAEPTFKEGGSVNDAVNAIPQGYERVNIEQEALDMPLLNPEFYKPCKLSASQHFEIKFAIWEGHAVGLDIKTTPNNKNAETCLRGLVSKNVWRDKVKSLNISTVTF